MTTITKEDIEQFAASIKARSPESAVAVDAFAALIRVRLVDEPKPWSHAPQQVLLTGAQLVEALDFIAPDRETDKDQLEAEICIAHLDGAKNDDGSISPAGLYMWDAEYPEEGVTPLFDVQPESAT